MTDSPSGRPEPSPPEAPPAAGIRFLAPLLAWVFPGLGHWVVGRKGKALVFFSLITFSLLFGLHMDGKLYRPVRGDAFAMLGSYACLGYGPAYFVLKRYDFAQGDLLSPTNEYGNRFVLTGGLMNLLLMLDAYDLAMGRKKKRGAEKKKKDEKEKAEAEAPGAEAPAETEDAPPPEDAA